MAKFDWQRRTPLKDRRAETLTEQDVEAMFRRTLPRQPRPPAPPKSDQRATADRAMAEWQARQPKPQPNDDDPPF